MIDEWSKHGTRLIAGGLVCLEVAVALAKLKTAGSCLKDGKASTLAKCKHVSDSATGIWLLACYRLVPFHWMC